MEVTTTSPFSWFPSTAQETTTNSDTIPKEEEITPDNIEQTTDSKEEEVGSGKEGEEKTENTEKETTDEVPEPITEFFNTILKDEKYNTKILAWENAEIKSGDDIVDLIQLNAEKIFNDNVKNVDQAWYYSKPPAFQKFAEIAELVGDDIQKLYQFIEGQKSIDDFSSLDTKSDIDAELIVENYLRSRGDKEEVIKADIADLRERGKLSEKADLYKPVMIANIEKKQADEKKRIDAEVLEVEKRLKENETQVISFLQPSVVGGMVLETQDKNLVYEHLSYNPELDGFPVFKLIEDLQEQKKFDILAKIILLAKDEENFDKKYSVRTKEKVQQGVRRMLQQPNSTTEAQNTNNPKPKPQEKKQQQADEGKVYSPWAR